MRTRWPSEYRRRPAGQPSPRIALAQRLYATGAAPTMRQASELAGLNPNGLSYHRHSYREEHLATEARIMDAITDKAISASALIKQLGIKAVQTLDAAMEGNDPKLAVEAAKDLLDRNPETSKTQRVQSESFMVRPQDIAALQSVLRESEALNASPLPAGNSIQLHQAPASLPSSSEAP